MVAAAREPFDPYAGLVVEAGSIFSVAKRVVSRATRPVGKTFRAVARTAPGKAAIQMGKIATVPLLGVVPGASAQVDRALDAVSRGNFTGARRAAVAAGVELAPIVQQSLKSFGPPGLAAAAAIGALAAGAKGANMEEIAWAAAEGGAPQGIDAAIKAAHEIRRGGSPANLALSAMSGNLVPGSPAAAGFNLAQQVLSGNAGGATAEIVTKLAAGRRSLPTEQARRGFDLAIGTVSRAMKNTPAKRAMTDARVPMGARPRQMTAMGGAHELARGRLERDPALARESLATVARKLRVSPVTAKAALGAVRARFRWRPLTSLAARFVERHAPTAARVALRDTTGLSDANTIYVVEPGDGPQRIGDKLLGKGQGVKRWKELIRANPNKSVDPKTGNFKILAVAERLKLPASWTAEINARSGGSTVATVVAAAPAPSGTRFVVVLKGEGPSQIAKSLTGDANRINELRNANFPRDADGRARKSDGKMGFSPGLNPGDRLFVPVTWPAHSRAIGISATPVLTTPALPTVPVPTPVVAVSPAPGVTQDLAAILQAKAILAAWGKTDGQSEAGMPDYGMRPEDVSGVFASRDRFMLASFSSWSNRTQGTRLGTSGDFAPEHADALRAWAERRAGLPLPSSPTAPPATSSPPVPAPPSPTTTTPAAGTTPPTPEPTKPPGVTPPPAPTAPAPGAPVKKKDDGAGAALLAVAIPLAAALL